MDLIGFHDSMNNPITSEVTIRQILWFLQVQCHELDKNFNPYLECPAGQPSGRF